MRVWPHSDDALVRFGRIEAMGRIGRRTREWDADRVALGEHCACNPISITSRECPRIETVRTRNGIAGLRVGQDILDFFICFFLRALHRFLATASVPCSTSTGVQP